MAIAASGEGTPFRLDPAARGDAGQGIGGRRRARQDDASRIPTNRKSARERACRSRGFTLVEVLVALMVVAIGLAALMIAVSGTARTSGYLRDKTLAQWIALNRLTEVRLTVNKLGQNTDTGELEFANRTWHYDTRYFDTSIASMKRVVVRVWLGDANTKGNPVAESIGFHGLLGGHAGQFQRRLDRGHHRRGRALPAARSTAHPARAGRRSARAALPARPRRTALPSPRRRALRPGTGPTTPQ